MPINAPAEYFKAEEKYHNVKTVEEKMLALEEMLRLLPKHKGTENLRAQLTARLAKLRKEKESAKKKGARAAGLRREGEAQVCLVGKTMSGKSLILRKITNAKPQLAEHPYTTTKPGVGMMEWKGILMQIVEIPATFEPRFLSMARTADLVCIVSGNEKDSEHVRQILDDSFVRTKSVVISPEDDSDRIKGKIWSVLDMIIVYTRAKGRLSPMALKQNAAVRDFCSRIHKDFLRNFRFAFIWRKIHGKDRRIQAGLDFALQYGDIVEVHMK